MVRLRTSQTADLSPNQKYAVQYVTMSHARPSKLDYHHFKSSTIEDVFQSLQDGMFLIGANVRSRVASVFSTEASSADNAYPQFKQEI